MVVVAAAGYGKTIALRASLAGRWSWPCPVAEYRSRCPSRRGSARISTSHIDGFQGSPTVTGDLALLYEVEAGAKWGCCRS